MYRKAVRPLTHDHLNQFMFHIRHFRFPQAHVEVLWVVTAVKWCGRIQILRRTLLPPSSAWRKLGLR